MEKVVRKILFATIVIITVVAIWLYLCFCRFNQIGIDTYTNPKTWNDTIVHIQDVIANYPKTMFILKGTKFEYIPCRDLEIGTKRYIANIRFNWDNTITYNVGSVRGFIKIDSINIVTQAYKPIDTIDWKCASDDSIFYNIIFFDKKKNSIQISRQKCNLPYGGKRNGIYIDIGELHLGTGKSSTSPFDY